MSPTEHPTVKAARQAAREQTAAAVGLNKTAAQILALAGKLGEVASQPAAEILEGDAVAAVALAHKLAGLVDQADTYAGKLARLHGATFDQLGAARGGQAKQNARAHYRRKGIDQ